MRVAVIGAGASGLTCIKNALEYGFEVECLEKSNDIAGLWRYKPGVCNDEGSVMKSTSINTNKEMTAFSDYPPADKTPAFMHNVDMCHYIRDYADHFKLLSNIRFNTEVRNIERSSDFESTGRWTITTKHVKTGEIKCDVFDGVFLCIGHHCIPYKATFKGESDFKGNIIHAQEYKTHVGYEDKNVVIVGIGNSGMDIAVELGKICNKTYLVARRGAWVWKRVFENGIPYDAYLVTRWMNFLRLSMPTTLMNMLSEATVSRYFDHAMYGMMPEHRFFEQHPTVNDEIPNRIITGAVIMKHQIKELLAPQTVIFVDGTQVDNIDTLIVATGYSFSFPMLEEGRLVPVTDNRVELYKNIYSPKLQQHTLAIIGLVQPFGSIIPISEQQARLHCAVLAGHVKLPDCIDMEKDIEAMKKQNAHFVTSRRHTLQVDYAEYMITIGNMIGCNPSLFEIFKKDPRFAWRLFLDPLTPYQFRLVGPHKWEGAENACRDVWRRLCEAPVTRRCGEIYKFNGRFAWFALFISFITYLFRVIAFG